MKNIYLILFIIFLSSCSEPNEQTTTEVNPLYYQQWYINHDENFYARNNINENANINTNNLLTLYKGKGIKVAIIDDGFDVNHPDLKNTKITSIALDYNGNIISTDVSHTNSNEAHGTAVTGIIAANVNNIGIRGIAPEVELILIKYPETFSELGEIELFKKAVQFGADIINCSWGTGDVSDSVRDYINEISNTARNGKGVIVVFASGNDDLAMRNDESSLKNVISVGATSKDNLRTSYSNYGKNLDIVAPGGEYLGISTLDDTGSNGLSNDDYIRYDEYKNGQATSFIGTSASAPIISGVIALALEKNPNLTRQNIQDILKYSTNTIGNNTPYLDDMISSSSKNPIITGILGKLQNIDIKIKLISKSHSTVYGLYDINIQNNNTFSSNITDDLPEDEYIIRIVDTKDTMIWASDEDFTINYNGANEVNKLIKRSYFYGYGKVDLEKFMSNIY